MFRRYIFLPSSESTVCWFWLGYVDRLEEGEHVTLSRGTEGEGMRAALLRCTLVSLHRNCSSVSLERALFLTVPFPSCASL
jgi:hypothetical protein